MKRGVFVVMILIAFSSKAQESYKTYLKAGAALQSKGENQRAIDLYTVALNEGPCPKILLQRGEALVSIGEFTAAYADFEKVIALDKKNGRAYFCRGREKHRQNDVIGALEDYNKAIKCKLFDDEELFYLMAKAKISLRNYSGAIEDLDYIIAQNPFHQSAFLARGFAWKSLNDYKGALSDYNKAIKLDDNCPTAYLQRGILKHEKEDMDGAISDLDKVITLEPKNNEALYYRGLSKYKSGDMEGALADLNSSKTEGHLEAVLIIKEIEKLQNTTVKSR